MKKTFKNLFKIISCLYSSNNICILENKSYKIRLFYVILFWLIQGIFGFMLYPIFGLFVFGSILEYFNDSVIFATIITLSSLYILVYIILFIFAYFSPLVEVKENIDEKRQKENS